MPSHIIASMHGLNELSTYGAHPKDFDPEQVKPVLVNLDIIIKWYLKYKEIGKDIKAKPTEVIEQNIKVTEEEKKSITIPKRRLIGVVSKNILQAGIYIVNDIDFKENKLYRFKDLLTIDNKHLPDFDYEPKLIIRTNTGENLRIKKITNEYFIFSKPISKSAFIVAEEDNPEYPKTIKFDVWIADYKTK